jgi:predicted permease
MVRVGDAMERLNGPLVSWNYFDVLGVRPQLGRTFLPEEDSQTAARVVILSDGLWTRLFARDPGAIGRTLLLDREPATIVGIMPPEFSSPPDARGLRTNSQLWVPAGHTRFTSRSRGWINPVLARLRDGVTIDAAQAEMNAIATRLETDYPNDNRGRGVEVVSLDQHLFAPVRRMLLILFGAVGVVLLIGCVNVASLLLVRGAARRREIALRGALGADRWKIVRLLLVESLILSLAGGVIGLLLAVWIVDALIALNPVTLPEFVRLGVDRTVLFFTFILSTVSGLVFGVLPSLSVTRVDLVDTLKSDSRTSSPASSPFRFALVGIEVALAIVLMTGAGLMLRTLDRLRSFDPGFEPHGLLSTRIWLPRETDPRAHSEKYGRHAADVLDRVRRLPGVRDAAVSWDMPLGNIWGTTSIRTGDSLEGVRVRRHVVSRDYFRTMGVPVLEGRDFEVDELKADGRSVVIVSKRLIERYWPAGANGGAPRFLREGDRIHEVVGVVGDVQHTRLLEPATTEPDVYFPFDQFPTQTFVIVARPTGSAATTARAVRQLATDVSGESSVDAAQTGDTLFANQMARQQFAGALLLLFASIALSLTALGIYGVVAFTVAQQQRQFGIRLALGATRYSLLLLVVRETLTCVLFGITIGIAAAAGFTRLLVSLIYGVSATDPATFCGVVAVVAIIGSWAALLPARKAASLEPSVVLRAE